LELNLGAVGALAIRLVAAGAFGFGIGEGADGYRLCGILRRIFAGKNQGEQKGEASGVGKCVSHVLLKNDGL
jgi:hypothetical protein